MEKLSKESTIIGISHIVPKIYKTKTFCCGYLCLYLYSLNDSLYQISLCDTQLYLTKENGFEKTKEELNNIINEFNKPINKYCRYKIEELKIYEV